jgi:autotransporter-associated beta strand protein
MLAKHIIPRFSLPAQINLALTAMLFSVSCSPICAQGTFSVTVATGTGVGSMYSAILQANAFGNGAVINIANNLGTINVGQVPDITVGLKINGGTGNTLSGQNLNRIFFVNAPGQAVEINNLTLSGGLAQGGAGGTGGGGGGGGAGLGGAVFVNAGSVTFSSIAFASNSAKGGNGSNAGIGGGGGGGGLGFAGGNGSSSDPALRGPGGGGGAKTSAGQNAVGLTAGNGGGIHGGAAGPSGTLNDNGSNATAPDGGGGGGGYDNQFLGQANGGRGGLGNDFGGGGGGGGSVNNSAGDGRDGGFGGGGGGGGDSSAGSGGFGGAGGFGGGGGGAGGSPNILTQGPFLGGSGGFGGGTGGNGNEGAGGGGAAFGGAVFVRAGASASFVDSGFDAGSLTSGSGGFSSLGQGHNGTSGSASGSALFLMGGNTSFTVSNAAATQTIVGTIAESTASSITKAGAGTLVLSGANSYSGGTNVNAGTLRLPDRAVPGSIVGVNSGAVLDYNDSGNLTQQTFTYTGSGTLRKTGAGKLIFGGQGNVNVSFSTGALIDVQQGTLVGTSSYQGVWANNRASVNIAGGATFDAVEGGPAGTLQFDALTGAGTFTGGYFGAFDAMTTATIGVADGGGTFSGSIGDDAGAQLTIVKAGSGTETLTGSDSYTGGTTISGGALVIGSSNSLPAGSNVTNNASLVIDANSIAGNVSGSGTTTIAAGSLLQAGSFSESLTLELGGASAAANAKLKTAGLLFESGTLKVSLVNDFKPMAGDNFDLLDWGVQNGAYSNIQLPPLAGGLTWDMSQLNVSGRIIVGGLMGDYNHNGTVDAADYTLWRDTLGSTTNLAADGNANGVIDAGDYDVWKMHFGEQVLGSGASAPQAVPEPASLSMLLAGVVTLLLRRRFRSPTTTALASVLQHAGSSPHLGR